MHELTSTKTDFIENVEGVIINRIFNLRVDLEIHHFLINHIKFRRNTGNMGRC